MIFVIIFDHPESLSGRQDKNTPQVKRTGRCKFNYENHNQTFGPSPD